MTCYSLCKAYGHICYQILGGMLAREMSLLEPTASREYVQMLARGNMMEDANECSEEEETSGNCESLSSNWQVGEVTTNIEVKFYCLGEKNVADVSSCSWLAIWLPERLFSSFPFSS